MRPSLQTGARHRAAAAAPRAAARVAPRRRACVQVAAGTKEVRDRIASVRSTSKITEAMKLVSAAKVRRAQDAVLNARPFSETLVQVLFGVQQRLRADGGDECDGAACSVRPVRCVLLVVVTGDRGLCGGYNNFVLKQTERRQADLAAIGVRVKIVAIGRKGQRYFRRRAARFDVVNEFSVARLPSTRDAQAVSDEVLASFLTEECDKVELLYTKFVSLISSKPTVQTLLPLAPQGEMRTAGDHSVDHLDDEVFHLTTRRGRLEVKRDVVSVGLHEFDPSLIFEQSPDLVMDALTPLYLNSCLLRALQEALASELASRMTAMSNATENAKEIRRSLNIVYNRKRQAKITQELAELTAGAAATSG